MNYLYDISTLENYEKHCILLKTTLEIALFFKVCEQTAAFDIF